MTPVRMIQSLADIAPRYDAVICDVWGVVHNGRTAYEAAGAALVEFRRTRGAVLMLSNAPRPGADVVRLLGSVYGVRPDAYDAVLTSGDATRTELISRATTHAPVLIHHIGPERDHPLIDGLQIRRVPLEQAELILCSGPFNDETETPADYRATFERAIAQKLAMICANPDLMVERGPKLIYCAGALAQLYEEMGGKVIYFGKPHRPIYELAARRLNEIKGKEIAPSKILAIGDGLHTDIKGANEFGIDILLVTAGLHVAEFGSNAEEPDPRRIAEVLQSKGLTVTAAMPRLR
jgi:HAD superfamily hydrolase (TIGR01459 family)